MSIESSIEVCIDVDVAVADVADVADVASYYS